MKRSSVRLAHAVTCAWTWTMLALSGCGHAVVVPPEGPPNPPGPTPEEVAAWEDASTLFSRHEAEGRWDGEACHETLAAFERVSEAREGQNPRAVYMMGLVASRCGSEDRAAGLYRRALELEPTLCEARVGLALQRLHAGDEEAARQGFEVAISDDNLCASGYVNLAALQARHPSQREQAVANLRRALSVRADYLPALDQMALVYLGWSEERPELLDLAEVVCRQAQLIDPDYAPIYNTWALIDVQQGDITGAAAKLARAAELDPSFFEAHMNFGQLTLSQRAYRDAAAAFEAARRLRPESYDAAVGLGVAMRGLSRPEEAERMYRAALELDGDRPEAYFDLAVLYQEHRDGTSEQLQQAEAFLRDFVQRARGGEFGDQIREVIRWCDATPSRRRRRTSCQLGRVQVIRQSLALMRGESPPTQPPAWIRELTRR